IMAAAVADFRPATATDQKIKKDEEHSAPTIILEQKEDVLHTVIQQRAAGQDLPGYVIGFAAETGDANTTPLEYDRAKMQRKGCEMLEENEIGDDKVVGQDENDVNIVYAVGSDDLTDQGTKDVVEASILQELADALN